MKFGTNINQYIEFDVSIAEIIEQIENDYPSDSDEMKSYLGFLGRAHAAYSKVPDSWIQNMESQTREIIADALRKQADRFDPSLQASFSEVHTVHE